MDIYDEYFDPDNIVDEDWPDEEYCAGDLIDLVRLRRPNNFLNFRKKLTTFLEN